MFFHEPGFDGLPAYAPLRRAGHVQDTVKEKHHSFKDIENGHL